MKINLKNNTGNKLFYLKGLVLVGFWGAWIAICMASSATSLTPTALINAKLNKSLKNLKKWISSIAYLLRLFKFKYSSKTKQDTKFVEIILKLILK